MSILEIKQWFEAAVPAPTDKNREVQVGVHFEELTEMLESIFEYGPAYTEMRNLADWYKQAHLGIPMNVERKDLLDSLCDQIVTAVGVAHMFGLDITDALAEVARSNASKFVDGKPLFNEHGKIIKGPDYRPPNLEPFL